MEIRVGFNIGLDLTAELGSAGKPAFSLERR